MTNGKLMPPPPGSGGVGVGVNVNGHQVQQNFSGNNGGMTTSQPTPAGRNNFKYYDVDGLGPIPEKVGNHCHH